MNAPTLDDLRVRRDEVIARRLLERAQEMLAGDHSQESLTHSALGALDADDADLARRLMERAEVAATMRLAAFSAWAEDPDAGIEVQQSPLRSRTALESDARRELAEIRGQRSAMSTPAGRAALCEQARARNANQRLERLLELVEATLADLLAAHEPTKARALAAEVFAQELDDPVRAEQAAAASEQDLELLGRLVRARRALGEPLHHGTLPRIGRMRPRALEVLGSPRAVLPASLWLPAAANGRYGLPEAADAETWRRHARAAAYHPSSTTIADPQAARAEAFASWIPVEAQLFLELGRAFVADPVFLEPALLVRGHPTRDKVSILYAALRLGALVDGREHMPAMIVKVGETRAETATGQRRKALGLWRAVGVRDGERVTVREWDGEYLGAETPRGGLPIRAPLDLYGIDYCDHPDGRWQPNQTVDALMLNCPTCRRRQIAVVPRHRLPADHKHHILRESEHAHAAYLRREAFYRELAGEGPAPGDLEELVRAEPPLSLEPGDYAVRPAPADRSGGFTAAFGRGAS